MPPGAPLTVHAETPLEAILFSTPAPAGGKAAVVTPRQVEVNARGKGNYAREVHNLFVTDAHAKRLMVGETFNPPGNWSSYPPHKHDGKDGEPVLEEVYYYRISPPQGFGQQMLYTADGESTRTPYGRRRGAAALRLPPGRRASRLQALLPLGDGRRRAQARAARGSDAHVDSPS